MKVKIKTWAKMVEENEMEDEQIDMGMFYFTPQMEANLPEDRVIEVSEYDEDFELYENDKDKEYNWFYGNNGSRKFITDSMIESVIEE